MAKNKYFIVIMGPQGSGKSTQAKILAKGLKIPFFSTGRNFRLEARKKTLLAEQISTYINQGKLVPDEITNAVVEKKLTSKPFAKGFIMDGYPRTVNQAKALENMVGLTHVILVDIGNKEALHRISGRETCPECGETYHLKLDPPIKEGFCDKCGSHL